MWPTAALTVARLTVPAVMAALRSAAEKYVGRTSPNPVPGISMSRPSLMKLVAWLAPQSEVTKPLKPSSPRRIPVRVCELPQEYGPGVPPVAGVADTTETVL